MKKIITSVIFAGMFFSMTAYADVLPAGKKQIPVCAYFSNTEAMLNSIAVVGIESAPDGSRVDLSVFIANECFKPSYKFNTYRVFGLAADHVSVTNSATYEPAADPAAYPTNIQPEMGYIYVDDTSTLTEVRNQYKIVSLDTQKEKLMIEPESTSKYYSDQQNPVITVGSVTYINGTPDTQPTGDDAFSDVHPDNPYYNALVYLKGNGIVSGYPDGSFKPDNTINRAELTKIIVGAAYTEKDISDCPAFYTNQSDYRVILFPDVVFMMVGGNEPAWYFNYVCVGKHEGFIGGYPDGSFKPSNEINFAEAAKIITKGLGQDIAEGTPWYKGYVEKLADNGAIPTTIARFDQKITRGEMAEIIYRIKSTASTLPSQQYSDLK
jgi:hypothetical protein